MSLESGFPILLQTAPRDVRAIHGTGRRHSLSMPMHATEFAKNILARFTDRAWLWIPQGLVFRLERPASPSQYFQNHVLVQIAPSLALTVLSWREQPGSESNHPLPHPTPRITLGEENQALKRIVHSTRSAMPDELVERLMIHSKRIERETTQAIYETLGQSTMPSVPPVGRVVRRSAPVKSEHNDLSQVGSKKQNEFVQTPESMHHPAPRLAPELNVNQLTDQVIRVIDQRILAQRERLGKV